MTSFFPDPDEGFKPSLGLEQSFEAVSSPEPDEDGDIENPKAGPKSDTNASNTPTSEVKDQSDSSNLDADLLLMDQNLELIYD